MATVTTRAAPVPALPSPGRFLLNSGPGLLSPGSQLRAAFLNSPLATPVSSARHEVAGDYASSGESACPPSKLSAQKSHHNWELNPFERSFQPPAPSVSVEQPNAVVADHRPPPPFSPSGTGLTPFAGSFFGPGKTGFTPGLEGMRTGFTPGGAGSAFMTPGTTSLLESLAAGTEGLQPMPPPPPPPPPPQSTLTVDPHTVIHPPMRLAPDSQSPFANASPALHASPPQQLGSHYASPEQNVRHLNPVVLPTKRDERDLSLPYAHVVAAAADSLYKLSQERTKALRSAESDEASSSSSSKAGKRKASDPGPSPGTSPSSPRKRRSIASCGPGTAEWRALNLGPDVPPIQKPVGRAGNRKVQAQEMTEEEKRKDMLDRNRQAALRCRQRKKRWLATLQDQAEVLTADNEMLRSTVIQLREEVAHLKSVVADIRTQQAYGAHRPSSSSGHVNATHSPDMHTHHGGWA